MSGPRFSIIPAAACTDQRLIARDLQVLCLFGRHTDDEGWCRRSQVRMAREMGCARSTVFDAIERLIAAGYIERLVVETGDGRDSAHMYRVVLDTPPPAPGIVQPVDAEDDGTPADQSAPPADQSAPPAGSGPAPINDSCSTIERVRAADAEKTTKAIATLHTGETVADEAGAAALDRIGEVRAVQRWLKKTHPVWPTYVSDSDGAALKAAMTLSADEREQAGARIADYVLSVKAHGRSKFCTFGVYLSEKRWEKLPPPRLTPAAPEDYAPPFGPVWSAWRIAHLSTAKPDAAGAWPAVAALHRNAALRKGHRFGERWHVPAVVGAMEPVPVGSETWRLWEALHVKRGWPWLPDPGAMRVVYFPDGGPDGLDEFLRVVGS